MPRNTAFAAKFMPVYRGGRWEEGQLVWDDSIAVGQGARTLAAQDNAGIREGATDPGWDELIKVRVGERTDDLPEHMGDLQQAQTELPWGSLWRKESLTSPSPFLQTRTMA